MDLLALLQQAFVVFAVFFHESYYLPLAAIAAVEFFLVKRRKEFVVALAFAVLLAFFAQFFFAEPRPCQVDLSLARFVECKASFGMPSLHATVAGVFVVAALGTLAFYFIAPLALLIAASRVFLGVHSVSQVVAGLAFGMLVYLLVTQLSDRLQGKKVFRELVEVLELHRQFVHALFGIVVAALALAAGRENALVALTGFLFLGMLAINVELRGRKSVFSVLFKQFERERVAPGKGALNFAVGALFLLAFSPSVSFAVGVLLILGVADAFSTIVGSRATTSSGSGGGGGARKHALFWNSGKSWEGLIAFIVTGFPASFYFLGLASALLYSVFLAIVESLDFGVDDNILIPVAAILLNSSLAVT